MEERAELQLNRPRLDMTNILKALHECSPTASVFSVLHGYGCINKESMTNDEAADVNLPKQLYHLYKPENTNLSSSDLDHLVASAFTDIKVSPAESCFLEQSTRNQANSYLWLEHRRGLITASHFHAVLHFSGRTYPTTIVKGIMQYSSPNPSIPALNWGRIHEVNAFQEYTSYMSSHDTVVVHKSGLVINPKYPYIGASPDGVVSCMCCGDGLLEIKCPFKYRDKSPTDEEALNDKNYCLVRNDHGDIHLSPTHAYYDQV